MVNITNLIGQKFNNLTVISYHSRNETDHKWICQCDCGTIKVIRSKNFKSGNTKSCGCFADGLHQKNK
jgi:hypothetical protein